MSMENITYGFYGKPVDILCVQDGVAIDISEWTTLSVVLIKPVSGETLTKTGSFKTDGTDGYLRFTPASGDIDELGIWEMQPQLSKTGAELNGDIVRFSVGSKLA